MPSPFPGMDPFLEASWGDVHTRLTTYACDLQPRLPSGLRARMEEYIHLYGEDTTDSPRFNPDARIVERASSMEAVSVAVRGTAVAATPIIVPVEFEWTERWIEILDSRNDRVVTTIEFLSPGNKHSLKAREEFRAKQHELLDAGVNLVEIDLLRNGGWAISVPYDRVPHECAYPYCVAVLRPQKPLRAELYPMPIQEPLPSIRVPLRQNEPDIQLDLQSLIDEVWARGRYSDIDYANARRPGFNNFDEEWIRTLIDSWTRQKTSAV